MNDLSSIFSDVSWLMKEMLAMNISGYIGEILFCNGGGFLSVKECFQWDRVPSILPIRTKSQGNEVILSTYYHSNLIRTTPLLIEFCLSKFKTKINQVKLKHHLLQDTFTVVHKTNNQLVPNLFNVYQLFVTIGVPIIVALFLSLLHTMFNVHTSSLLHYRTSQNTS